jgi:hypothetical protein
VRFWIVPAIPVDENFMNSQPLPALAGRPGLRSAERVRVSGAPRLAGTQFSSTENDSPIAEQSARPASAAGGFRIGTWRLL